MQDATFASSFIDRDGAEHQAADGNQYIIVTSDLTLVTVRWSDLNDFPLDPGDNLSGPYPIDQALTKAINGVDFHNVITTAATRIKLVYQVPTSIDNLAQCSIYVFLGGDSHGYAVEKYFVLMANPQG